MVYYHCVLFVALLHSYTSALHCIIDLLAILQKSLNRALILYNSICEIRSSGVRGSIAIMHIRKFFKLHHNIVRFRFFPRIAKRSIVRMREFDMM